MDATGLMTGLFEDRRVKDDYRDCCDLLDRMRRGNYPRRGFPYQTRELREPVRCRHSCRVAHRPKGGAQGGAGQAQCSPASKRPVGASRPVWLDHLDLPKAYRFQCAPFAECRTSAATAISS